jgi:hypothetical protein
MRWNEIGVFPAATRLEFTCKIGQSPRLFIKIRLQYKYIKAMPEEFLNSFKRTMRFRSGCAGARQTRREVLQFNLFNLHVT